MVIFSLKLFSIPALSIDREKELVNLSLLSEDTGEPDVLPESLGLPLHFTKEEKKKHDAERMKKKRKLPESEQVSEPMNKYINALLTYPFDYIYCS